MNLYAENILDHYKNPRRYGKLKGATVTASEANPICGDKIEVDLMVNKDGIIEDASFIGEGCAISTASISMIMEDIVGKQSSEVLEISNEYVCESMGIPVTSARNKCALLGFFTIKKALKDGKT